LISSLLTNKEEEENSSMEVGEMNLLVIRTKRFKERNFPKFKTRYEDKKVKRR